MTDNFSPRHQQLLEELAKLTQLSEQVAQKLAYTQRSLAASERELTQLHQQVLNLKQENLHLRETMQAWKRQLEETLQNLELPH